MSRDLYFLRSSEQHILKDMVKIANIPENEEESKYIDFYGLTSKDIGLYALVDNQIAGAIWSRELGSKEPQMCLAIVENFKSQEVDSFMMEQFLIEAGASYESICIDISAKKESLKFYEKFGFVKKNENSFMLHKKLEKKEVVRPTDGYDSSRWMD